MSKIRIYSLLLILLALSSCGNNRSGSQAGILSEKKMVELLVDTHLTDAILFADNSRSDEKRDKALFYYPSLLEKHGITKTQMDSSVAWYMRNPAAYARVYEQVMKDLEKLQAADKKKEITE
ncbi:MAG: DUF4296 domain-containing protein [Porphyromonadaceae bacterium]|nr:MAG: DUF4296 domain-containing protein [Porphyromonadaceae bacterium]